MTIRIYLFEDEIQKRAFLCRNRKNHTVCYWMHCIGYIPYLDSWILKSIYQRKTCMYRFDTSTFSTVTMIGLFIETIETIIVVLKKKKTGYRILLGTRLACHVS